MNFSNLKEYSSKLLLGCTSLSLSMYLNLSNINNEYTINNEYEMKKYENVIPTKEMYEDVFDKINKSDKENIVITYDGLINSDHGKNVKGIIDTKLKENNIDNIDSFYVPKVLGFKIQDDFKSVYENLVDVKKEQWESNSFQRQFLKVQEEIKTYNKMNETEEIYDKISKIDKNKNIYINQSFGHSIAINKDHFYKLSDLKESNNRFTKIEEENNKMIKFLNENKNVQIASSAGNNFALEIKSNNSLQNGVFVHSNVLLKQRFDKLTNNDYEKTKELSSLFNYIIEETRKNENNGIKMLEKTKKDLEPLFSEKKVNFDDFMNLYIIDYLTNYDSYDLLKKTDQIKNDNLKIVESFSEYKLYTNYVNYKHYHKKEIPEFEERFSGVNKMLFVFNEEYDMSKEQLNDFKKFIAENKDKYPEIFKYNVYNTFNSLVYDDSKLLEQSVENQNGIGFKPLKGTSFATPEYLSDKIVEKNKNFKEKEIEEIAFNGR